MNDLIRAVNRFYLQDGDPIGRYVNYLPNTQSPPVNVVGILKIAYPIDKTGEFPALTVSYQLSGPTASEMVIKSIYDFYQQRLTSDNIAAYVQQDPEEYGHLKPGMALADIFVNDPQGYVEGLARSGDGYELVLGYGEGEGIERILSGR